MNKDYKICFVCTGNACRSPFAECVTRKLLTEAELSIQKTQMLSGMLSYFPCMQ